MRFKKAFAKLHHKVPAAYFSLIAYAFIRMCIRILIKPVFVFFIYVPNSFVSLMHKQNIHVRGTTHTVIHIYIHIICIHIRIREKYAAGTVFFFFKKTKLSGILLRHPFDTLFIFLTYKT